MPVINFHVHPTSYLTKIRLDLTNVGVGAAVLLPVDIRPQHLLDYSIASRYRLSMSEFRFLTKYMNDLIKGWPEHMLDNWKLYHEVFAERDFFIPFFSIDPGLGVRYVEEKILEQRSLGLKGLFLSPPLQLFEPDDPGFEVLLDYAEKDGMVVVLHVPIVQDPLADFSRRLMEWTLKAIVDRDIRFVISGVGTDPARISQWFEQVAKFLRRFDDAYVDTADFNCALFNGSGYRLVNQLGIERFLFGSRYPCRSLEWLRNEIRCVTSSGLSQVEVEYVLEGNARELLGYIYSM